MTTIQYKAYQIVVYEIESNLGKGYRAAITIPNGRMRSIDSYRIGLTEADMLSGARTLIDMNLF